MRALSLASLALLAGCGGKVCWFGCGDDDPSGKPPAVEGCPPEGTVATWSNFAEGYVRTYCTPCHSSQLLGDDRYGAPEGVDFDSYESVVAQAALIEAWATGPNPLMPPVGGPSDDDVALLRQWLECGMPGGEPVSKPCGDPNHAPGDLVVASDADAVDFCASFNGVQGDLQVIGDVAVDLDCVCEVEGDVEVGGQARSVRLSQLAHVGGNLRVLDAGELTNLLLPELDTVGGDLEVSGNPALVELDVSSVDEVGGSFVVEDNDALAILWPTQLDIVGADWRVVGNDALVQVNTDHLLEIGDSFVLDDNASLRLMVGQAYNVRSIGGDLLIRDNPVMEHPELAFQELRTVGGHVEIIDNDGFTRVDAFEKLVEIGGHLWIRDNDAIGVLNGFDFLERVGGSLDLSGNAGFLAVDGAFRVLAEVGLDGDPALGEHQLRIQDNASLVALNDLLDVQRVGGLVVSGNGASFVTLDGFHALTEVTHSVEIHGNAGLAAVSGFGLLEVLGGDLRVHDNPKLYSLDALGAIDAVPGSLVVERNAALALIDFSGAVPLGSVGGDLVLTDNDTLTGLYTLATLSTIGGDLVLRDHAALVDVTALHPLVSVGGDLVVTGNPALPAASVEALRDAIESIGGAVTLDGNGP